MKTLLTISLLFTLTLQVFAETDPDDILGIWANSSNKAHIQIFQQGGRYYGKIVWLKNQNDAAGKPKVYKKNPDAKNRDKRIIGLTVLRDFKFDDNEWKNGRIYNPQDGKEYRSVIKLQNNKQLAVRGYIGFSLIGKTEKFTRVR